MMIPPQRGSFARAVFTTLATTVLAFSLALNFYFLLFSAVSSGGASAGGIQKKMLHRGSADKVVVIPVTGVIMDDTAEQFEKFIEQVEADRSIRGIVIQVDTPGGTVTASDAIHRRIARLRKDRGLKVVVSMGSLATSGGYYIACAADHIVAQPTTITGNIGVILQRVNATGLLEKIGVDDGTITSTGTPFKDAGSPLREERPEERAYLQALIDDAFAEFRRVVETGRTGRLKQPIAAVADGKAHSARQALALGLVDEVGYIEDAIAKAAALAGVTNPSVERYDRTPTLSEQLFGATSAKQNGVSVNLDASLIDRIQTPRLMYLWQAR